MGRGQQSTSHLCLIDLEEVRVYVTGGIYVRGGEREWHGVEIRRRWAGRGHQVRA